MLKNRLKIHLKKTVYGLFSLLFISWIAPITISDQESINSSPNLAVNDSGQALVVWTNGSYPDLVTQGAFCSGSPTNSSSWGTPITISTDGAQFNPTCGIDSEGNCIAAWESIIENETLILAATKPLLGNWSEPFILSNSPSNSSITLAFNNEGQIVVAWVDNENNAIKARHLVFGNSWSAISLVSEQGDYVGNLQSGIDASGNEIIVWEDFSIEMLFAAGTTAGFNSSWSDSYSITQTGTNTGPSLNLERTGNAIVAWTNVDTYAIEASLYIDQNWSLPVVISNDYGSNPTVATSGTEYFVTWNDLTSGGTFGATHERGSWSEPFQLSTNLQSDTPQVSSSLHTFFTVWSDLSTGYINVADYPTEASMPAPILLADEYLNESPYINSSTTTTIVAWQAINGDNAFIQISVNE